METARQSPHNQTCKPEIRVNDRGKDLIETAIMKNMFASKINKPSLKLQQKPKVKYKHLSRMIKEGHGQPETKALLYNSLDPQLSHSFRLRDPRFSSVLFPPSFTLICSLQPFLCPITGLLTNLSHTLHLLRNILDRNRPRAEPSTRPIAKRRRILNREIFLALDGT